MMITNNFHKMSHLNSVGWGAWVAQLVKRLTSAQVMISAGLCADSSQPGTFFEFCVSLSLCPARGLSLTLKNK